MSVQPLSEKAKEEALAVTRSAFDSGVAAYALVCISSKEGILTIHHPGATDGQLLCKTLQLLVAELLEERAGDSPVMACDEEFY